MAAKRKISVIVPVLDEYPLIRETLEHLLSLHPDELIFADGGSADGTVEVFESYRDCVRLVKTGRPNRALQMNRAAGQASGQVLLFVHTDMRLPQDAFRAVRAAVDQGFEYGGFQKAYDDPHPVLKAYVSVLNTVYLGMFKGFAGTNALFVTRDLFERAGGYPEVERMEDILLSDRLLRLSRPVVLKQKVTVSARRYRQCGILRQMIANGLVLARYRLGDRPKEISI